MDSKTETSVDQRGKLAPTPVCVVRIYLGRRTAAELIADLIKAHCD